MPDILPSHLAELPPEAAPLTIGGVTLAARDLPRLAGFYATLLGLEPVPEGAGLRFDLAGATLRLLAAPDARPERGDEPGLFHTAFLMPDRAALAGWLRHALALGIRLDGASDHGVSEALYLSDPEGNGIEVYADRPRALWPRPLWPHPPALAQGVAMVTRRLDLQDLLAATTAADPAPRATRIGHVHLRAGDLAATEAFYRGLGLEVMQRMPHASFLASGGYHHHVAINTWGSSGTRPAGLAGLAALTLRAASEAAFQRAAAALPNGKATDPSGNLVALIQAET
ncbi:VOC family protein [Roseomonas sp. M0104]|uniref:VOC family protein n=1 Tax=Teichococcus coralli TaxID=2545983 RepID=A0A845BHM7_9PROT|nr:VOC family protein [Pseudoroseomonas coralli]MXP64817.1 VOC family protein [Pseudoroseomonas coralli]